MCSSAASFSLRRNSSGLVDAGRVPLMGRVVMVLFSSLRKSSGEVESSARWGELFIEGKARKAPYHAGEVAMSLLNSEHGSLLYCAESF